MSVYKDQVGNLVRLSKRPQRIISLVPSQSEYLWDLGLRSALVGITKFCIHPDDMYCGFARVGGTKKLDLDKIRELKPDLIIGNKEENERSQIEELQKEFPVWMSDIYTFEDTFAMMKAIGEMLDKRKESETLVDTLRNSLTSIQNIFVKKRVAYFIWNKPYMLAASSTFIDHVLNHLGLENALSKYDRYPELNEDQLQEINPDICFLSSEPFPFKEEHVKELQIILPKSQIVIVDGEVFSWYGTRLLHLAKYVAGLPLRQIECQ